ncbi:isorenieratene synthase [Tessaracoccus aquimaris]|uniref:Isorenieratene synthase n=1 Tax=Tessaracoccus aquimaris TaxID=1332264 RepID=A0A1Q2CKF4_9ACTN|nr:FAD-dependent oxidoreductase [Tessaracoccus aquimaris]AQP46616.1 isorenieratene synthase [Tessaracoccus aquimaris]
MSQRPGRDPRAQCHPAAPGTRRVEGDRSALVVGGGIAGLAAATALAERGVRVTLAESGDRLGGRVAAWPLDGQRTMSRGFHAFFRQYYNLRRLLRRIDVDLSFLVPVDDYPLQRPDGLRDSFAGLVTTPPWSVLQFVARSPAFTARGLAGVHIPSALELLKVRFPDTYERYEGESAAAFLDRLRFPDGARDLALEVFARSFFADPREFGAGELVAMFHTYFLGSAEGLLFDVPDDDYDAALWRPLAARLECLGVDIRLDAHVDSIEVRDDGAAVSIAGRRVEADAVVLAADPRAARRLAEGIPGDHLAGWRGSVAATYNAPPFVVVRLWLDTPVDASRPAFLGTSGYGPLDNVSVLERFEAGAARWAEDHHGSVVELHAYACDEDVVGDEAAASALVDRLEAELHRVFPETAAAGVLAREVLVRDDCTLIGPTGWAARPGVMTPDPRLVLAGDWLRCGYPVALMERAATTGFLAANRLLARWGAAGHDIWTVPMRGLLARRRVRPASGGAARR